MNGSLFNDDVMKEKLRAVKIRKVSLSKDQPYQISRSRNGVFLYGCKDMDEVEAYLTRTTLEALVGGKVTSRRSCSR